MNKPTILALQKTTYQDGRKPLSLCEVNARYFLPTSPLKTKMHLNMYLDDVLIESIPINFKGLRDCIERQNYVDAIVEKLTERHTGRLIHTSKQPQFFLEGVPSNMNTAE